jgi:glucokinase
MKSLNESPSRPAHLKQANARGLLHLLRKHSPCSKADLVRFSGLSAPTVSSNIAHLENLGLVKPLGGGESSGGRPPGLMRFHSEHGFIAGADIGGSRLRMILGDLDGAVLTTWSVVLLKKHKTPLGICGLIAEGLQAMCQKINVPVKKVMHLTAGAPGATNSGSGVVLSAPNLADWTNIPLRTMLQQRLKIPVIVENDTNLAAVGERWKGAAEGADNFVFLALGTGFGAGIFINGQLYHGSRWSAGEVGYLGISGEKRKPIQTEKAGQLETAIGGEGIEAHWRKLIHLSSLETKGTLSKLNASEIFDLARVGDHNALEVLNHTAALIADAVVDLTMIIDPKIIVLGGGVGSYPYLCERTKKFLKRHQFCQPELRSSALGTQAQLFGSLWSSLVATDERLVI